MTDLEFKFRLFPVITWTPTETSIRQEYNLDGPNWESLTIAWLNFQWCPGAVREVEYSAY